ncbi:uL30 family ribosomal protein [Candidatus Micrarchaeota archaeon]|nr:uL30 family ribosomal protein [Candidatus Micrarchaeota archaeon]
MLIAIIRVRGSIGVTHKVAETMKQLHLTRKNHCVVIEETETLKGMLQKVKDYVTWGELTEETNKKISAKGKQPYRLNPPKGGFKGSIKQPYPKGALGNRKEKINDLVNRML